MYARALRLRHLNPGGIQCFLLFEAILALAALLALAELVPWWGVPVLPGAVAVMVKINDAIAGTVNRRPARSPGAAGWSRASDVAGWQGESRANGWPGDNRVGGWPGTNRVAGQPGSSGGGYPGGANGHSGGRHGHPGGVNGYPSGKATRDLPGTRAVGRAPGQHGPRLVPPADENTTLGLAHSMNVLQVTDSADSPQQRARQSAARRYE